ncbi:uncharacterized protein LOC118201069 isoform X2 [Stegodyphus dumicola]|uniref:uncharacterized protein LOC118201069 isoform X2 n=1 Tax=Stegodyphus dumicola TaxID=202533 RepID=UPI0015AC3634|nr:uncharacterized protein LOC118201069 isoform X2 [Stegodyphus dumicola]
MVMNSNTEYPPVKDNLSKIDWEFLPYKIHYFLLCSAHAGVTPYLPVFAKSRLGLNATTVGILSTCMQFSNTLSKPIFGLIVDCTKRMKAVLVFLICIEVIINLLILGIPTVGQTSSNQEIKIFLNSSKEQYLQQKTKAGVKLKGYIKNSRFFGNSEPRSDFNFGFTHVNIRLDSFRTNLPVATRKSRSIQRLNRQATNNNTSTCFFHCASILNATCLLYERNISQNFPMSCDLQFKKYFKPCADFNGHENNYITFTFEAGACKNFSTNITVSVHSLKEQHMEKHNLNSCNSSVFQCNLKCERPENLCQQTSIAPIYESPYFWTFSVLAILSIMFQGAIFTLSDTACYEKLKCSATSYGRQRYFGALGWGAMAPLTGFLNDLASDVPDRSYAPGFYMMAFLSAFLLLNVLNTDIQLPTNRSPLCQAEGPFLSLEFVFMEVCVFFTGFLTGYTANYVLWYLESLGSSKLLMGLALGVQGVLGEAPFIFYSGEIIFILGHWNILTISFLAFFVRFLAYYSLTNVWVILPVELLEGITYGLFYATITSYAEIISPQGTEATVQGIFGGTFLGLGAGMGSWIAGLSFDQYGGRVSFLIAAIISAVAAVMCSSMHLIIKNRKNKESVVLYDRQ